jgi:hypothetical protein
MKSEALRYLESRLAIGHINVQEFRRLHDLLETLNRLTELLTRTYSREIDWDSGTKLIAEEAADVRIKLSGTACNPDTYCIRHERTLSPSFGCIL